MYNPTLHIWLLKIPEDISPQELSTLKKILSSEEQKRMEGMGSAERQREYMVSHALARIKSAHFLGFKPSDIPLTFPDDEAPKLDLPGCYISLSHTTGFIAVALAACLVGVDVEVIKERVQMEGVAKRYCSEEEFRDLFQLVGEARLKRYAELATLKEAYLKAAGLKITEVIGQTSFKISQKPDGKVEVVNRCQVGSDPWQFLLFYLDPATVLALVVQTSEEINPQIQKVLFSNLISS